MPDFTMCAGLGCPVREECYRATARPGGLMQSWFDAGHPWTGEIGQFGEECPYYLAREADGGLRVGRGGAPVLGRGPTLAKCLDVEE